MTMCCCIFCSIGTLLFFNIGNINGAVRSETGGISLKELRQSEIADFSRQRTGYVEILRDIDFQVLEEAFRVIVVLDGPVPDYRLFFLNSPLRMVVDLPGNWKNSGESVLMLEHDMIRRVRVGEHPGYLRIVMDLVGKNPLSPDIEVFPNGLSFTMRRMPEYLHPAWQEAQKADAGAEKNSGASRRPDDAKDDAENAENNDNDADKRILKDILSESSEAEFRAVILSDRPILEYSSFFLTDEHPPKLVVDLAGKWRKPGKLFFNVANPMVENIRVGIHPAYLRIVMDLKEKGTPVSIIEESPEGLSIRVKKKEVVNFE